MWFFSFSDLLHSVWQSLGPSMSLQMTYFTFYGWVIYSIVYVYHVYFIHFSVSGHIGCFHALDIVNSAAMNIGVHVSFWIMIFSGYMPRSGIAGSNGSSSWVCFCLLLFIVVISVVSFIHVPDSFGIKGQILFMEKKSVN